MLLYLTLLSFPVSFPYDFIHLIWENLVKNLILFWTGEFKDLIRDRENIWLWMLSRRLLELQLILLELPFHLYMVHKFQI